MERRSLEPRQSVSKVPIHLTDATSPRKIFTNVTTVHGIVNNKEREDRLGREMGGQGDKLYLLFSLD